MGEVREAVIRIKDRRSAPEVRQSKIGAYGVKNIEAFASLSAILSQ